MGTHIKKPFLDLGGKPILVHTLEVFERCPGVDGVVLVTREELVGFCRDRIVDAYGLAKVCAVAAGGKERQDSVFQGLRKIPSRAGVVVVHDGVRPFASVSLVEETVEAARKWGAAVPALAVRETVKISDNGETVKETVDRRRVFLVQTPQAFQRDLLWEAHIRARKEGFYGTDDAVLVERMGHPVYLVPGHPKNIKITTPDDLHTAEKWLL